jgi:hypothetical protein
VGVEELLAARNDQVHRLVPARLDEFAVLAHQRRGQAVGRGVGLPAEEVLRVEAAVVDAVVGAAADPGDPPSFTAMSSPSPFECSTAALRTQRSTSSGRSPSARRLSTRTGHGSPGP